MMMKNIPDISGNWIGHDHQLRRGKPVISKIQCTFSQEGDKVSGKMVFINDPVENPIYISNDKLVNGLIVSIQGQWVNGKILNASWFPENEEDLNCGAFCLELMHNGDKLAGKFIGFGPISHAIVNGELILARDNS